MDLSENENNNRQSAEVPPVPIKTYKWEDVRRARKKGGYPWTYLDKKNFNESIDPDDFKMDGLKKSKTSSASSASDSLDIKEITEDDVKGLEGIDSSYVVIESPILLGRQLHEIVKEQEVVIESADSSDNISQYLDKEEQGPEQVESTETLTLQASGETEVKQTERAKSEEPKRKRRLSVDSNYSRISLSKLGVVKRLKNAKDKIKMPKFGDKTKKKKEVEVKEEKFEKPTSTNVEKPVYIHIPLKPPEGEKDEFSHLEFEEKKTLVTPEVRIEITEENVDEKEESEPKEPEESTKETNLGLTLPDDQEDDVSAIIFLEGEEGCENKGEYEIIAVDIDENSQEMKMSQITNTEMKRQVLESIKKVESQPDISRNNESTGGTLSRSSSKASKTSKTSIRKRRAKSVEPEKKRRSSIDSSYSRKSMSKLGLLKKLKSFHIPFLKSQSKKSLNENVTKPLEIEPKVGKQETGKEKNPVYIHIPLKPPEGQTDEFSHLEFDDAPPPPPKPEKIEEIESPIETPQKSPQFIILTPPSDDELLDKPELPETPSCETSSAAHLEDLQQLAKKAVDQIQNALGTVVEDTEDNSATMVPDKVEPTEEPDEGEKEIKEKLTIDEEDGLKSIPQTNDDVKTNLRSNLKSENSPLPKKKVSFKRRKSSQVSKDDGYEEIESPSTNSAPKGEGSEIVANSTVSKGDDPPVHEDEKLQSQSPIEENSDKWSKISDHEYEPVNPPPEEKIETSQSQSHVSEVLNPSTRPTHNHSDTSDARRSPSKGSTRSRSEEKEPPRPNKFQTAIKESATKFKTKLQGIKKPTISMPSRPKFQKPNFKKPNINLPKMPEINLTFRRTSKTNEKKESDNKASEETSSKGIFDFATYPRIFSKKRRDPDTTSLGEGANKRPEREAMKTKSSRPPEIIRIPLHSEESMEQEHGIFPQPEEILEVSQLETNDESSRHRYQEDTEADDEDAIQRERQEKHREAVNATFEAVDSRWDHGNFYRSQNGNEDTNENVENMEIEESPPDYDMEPEMVTDLDLPEEASVSVEKKKGRLQQNDSFDTNQSKVGSSVSSLGHRRGVLEEIDSDQFFLREKGISQDNIDMGKYLSTEIREAFRSPPNALADIRSYNYEEIKSSNQSLPETKRKPIKKPKRRKTPHTSQERIRYEPESENEDYNFMPPTRPKRKSRRKKRVDPEMEVVPFVQTIPLYPPEETENPRLTVELHQYENNREEVVEMPEPRYRNNLHVVDLHDAHRRASEPIPAAPPRKHKSLKSLNASEHDSIFEEYGRQENNEMKVFESKDAALLDTEAQEDNTVIPEMQTAPKPPTRCRSKTRSMSRTTSQADRDSILGRMDSIMFDEELREPVIEETCIKDLRDSMGYAIVDKNQNKNWEHKFCTVPRSQNSGNQPPERPLRNYSTLGPSRPERKTSRNMTDEEKENIDISQYIEIEDERDLQSGEIIQKIQNRPLPAPPRPPRCRSKPLSDITSKSNIDINEAVEISELKQHVDEIEVSTQTEPLPSDFECEEMVHEETDKIMTPSAVRKNLKNSEIEEDIEGEIKIPTEHSYTEETITHGQLLVEPLNGARILPDADLSPEGHTPLNTDEEETSEIPEHFKNLQDEHLQPENPSEVESSKDVTEEPIQEPCEGPEREEICDVEPQRPPRTQKRESFEVLKTQKLQVSDLDVERLTVNELVATKIVVSEIEGGTITANEINSKGGTLKLNDLELQPDLVKKLLEQLKQASREPTEDEPKEEEEKPVLEEKKTPIDFNVLETTSEDSKELPPPLERDVTTTPPPDPVEEDSDLINSNEQTTQQVEISRSTENISVSENEEVHDNDDPVPTPNLVESPIDFSEEETRAPPLTENEAQPISVKNDTSNLDQTENLTTTFTEETSTMDETPLRPPRCFEKKQNVSKSNVEEPEEQSSDCEPSNIEVPSSHPLRLMEPEVDDEPPPRPPQPQVPYVPSEPPAEFYSLRTQHYVDDAPNDIPLVPKRHRHHRLTTISKSSSSESSNVRSRRRRVRSPEPSIPHLTGQLIGACTIVARNKLKRLIEEINAKVPSDGDAETNKQNVQVIMVVLLILITVLLLLGYGDGRTVHLHHWEYFNPPTDV